MMILFQMSFKYSSYNLSRIIDQKHKYYIFIIRKNII